MREWRVSGLREPRESLFVPGIKPMVRIVRGHRHVEVGVEAVGWDLDHEQGPMKGQGAQNDQP